jgi:endonuclease/exonuclease/phosphatase (EEP) superfamily protein YafD
VLPVVLAGDLNATHDHRPFRRLLGAGLEDSHDVAGYGWARTWSARWWAATLRIDHVLVSRSVAVTGYRTGSAFGSDHLPVIATLAIPLPR